MIAFLGILPNWTCVFPCCSTLEWYKCVLDNQFGFRVFVELMFLIYIIKYDF